MASEIILDKIHRFSLLNFSILSYIMKIIELCKVTPSPADNSSAPKSLPLTFFDLLLLRIHPIQQLFFYKSTNEISFPHHILPNLKSSLALALHHYLPLAGHLLWPLHAHIPSVEVGDGDGVCLTVAESDADFERLSGNGFRAVEEYHPLVPPLAVSDDRAAVISLQITLFPNQGFSIGVSSHHAVLDGKTSTSFVKLWARLCNLAVAGEGGSSSDMTELMPSYDRSIINDSRDLARIYANAWLDSEGPNNRSLKLKLPKIQPDLVRCTLELTHKNVQKLKQWIMKDQNEQKEQKKSHISSFASTNAYLCVCTSKFKNSRDGNLGFVFPADVRSRLKPPLPRNYFGNCLFCCGVSMERSKLSGEKGLVVACEAISELVQSLEDGAFLNGAEDLIKLVIGSITDYSAVDFISVAGSPKFEVYSADFGWGKPRKVEFVSAESSTVISLTDSRNDEGGMEIGVVKNRDEMESFVAMFVKGLESDFTSHD